MNPLNGGWIVWLSLLVAMLLTVFHLPESWPQWLGWLRPNWILVVLFFWVVEYPYRIGLFAAWIVGFLIDGLLGQPLGLNGLILAGFTFVAWRFFERLRMYSMAQQCGVIFVLVLAAEILRGLVIGIDSVQGASLGSLATAFFSMLVWPIFYIVLLRISLKARMEQ